MNMKYTEHTTENRITESVTSDGARRNKEYEARKKREGLKKITLWVPEETEADFKIMAEYCTLNRGTTPFMVRELNTGKLRKGTG